MQINTKIRFTYGQRDEYELLSIIIKMLIQVKYDEARKN